jgi:hypothetical protein
MASHGPKCAAITLKGLPCKNRARPGSPYCGVHKNYKGGQHAAQAAAAPKLAHLAGKAKPTATHPPAAPPTPAAPPPAAQAIPHDLDATPYRSSGPKRTVGAYISRLAADPKARAQTKTKQAALDDGLVHTDPSGSLVLTPKGHQLAGELAMKPKPKLAALAKPKPVGPLPAAVAAAQNTPKPPPKGAPPPLLVPGAVHGQDDVIAYMTGHSKAVSYTAQHRMATRTYTTPVYREINGNLRHGSWASPAAQKAIAGLDSALQATPPLDKPVITQRGIRFYRDVLGDVKVGDTIHDKGFMSTSVDRNHAYYYATKRGHANQAALMNITIPPGVRALSILPPAPPNLPPKYGTEHEVLLPRGTSLRVDRIVRNAQGVTFIDATVVPA